MFAFASLAVLALALGVRADLVVSTPGESAQCQPVTFAISGSTAGPYFAFVVNSNDPCGDAVDEVQNISGSSFTWTPPAAGSYMIALESADGSTEGWSGAFTVDAGNSSCGSSGASSAASTPAAYTVAAGGSPTTTHTTTHATVAPANAASDLPVSDSSTNGASRSVVGFGSALALVGAAVAAFAL